MAKRLLSGVNREFGIEEEEQVKLPKSYKEQLQVLVEEKVPVVSFAFQTLEKEEINDLKRSGIKSSAQLLMWQRRKCLLN